MSFKYQEIEVIGTFTKNCRQNIKVRLVDCNKRLSLDSRLFFLKAGSDQELPSGKGLCLSLPQAESYAILLEKGIERLRVLQADADRKRGAVPLEPPAHKDKCGAAS